MFKRVAKVVLQRKLERLCTQFSLGMMLLVLIAPCAWSADDVGLVRSLEKQLRDPNEDVREFAAQRLGYMGRDASSAASSLLQATDDDSSQVAVKAAWALLRVDGRANVMAPLLGHSDPLVLLAAAEGMLWNGHDPVKLVPTLLELRKCGIYDVDSVFEALGPDQAAAVMPLLLDSLSTARDAEWVDQDHPAVSALSHVAMPAPTVVPDLIARLRHERPKVRTAAAEQLLRLGAAAKEAAVALRAGLHDPEPACATACAAALGAVDPDDAEFLLVLRESLRSIDSMDATRAASYLWMLGPSAAGLSDDLVAYLCDLQRRAHFPYYDLNALKRIGPPAISALDRALKEALRQLHGTGLIFRTVNIRPVPFSYSFERPTLSFSGMESLLGVRVVVGGGRGRHRDRWCFADRRLALGDVANFATGTLRLACRDTGALQSVQVRFIVAPHVGEETIMRLKAGAFSRYRPRFLTLVVLIVVAAPTVLANFSPGELKQDLNSPIFGALADVEYGWPLDWYWRNIVQTAPTQKDWLVVRYSWPRLVGNLIIGLVILGVTGIACEWLLRRYWPRLRWNLKSMLAAVGFAAIFCAWCAAVRNRANVQDPLIAAIEKQNCQVYLNRWGPKWLDLVGADRFRRRIIGATLWSYGGMQASSTGIIVTSYGGDHDDDLLRRLRQLPDMRLLHLGVSRWTPGLAEVLGEMGQLRILIVERCSFHQDTRDDRRMPDEVLAAIGNLKELEVLKLGTTMIANNIPAHLAGLMNLKALSLDIADYPSPERKELERLASIGKLPLLADLPALPRLESIGYLGGLVRDHDVLQLAAHPRLKSLNLTRTIASDAAWAELAHLKSFEELTISHDEGGLAAALEPLLSLERLKVLHIAYPLPNSNYSPTASLPLDKGLQMFVLESEVEDCRRALEALRQSNPGIVIDNLAAPFERRFEWRGLTFDEYAPRADRHLPDLNAAGMGFF